MKRRGGGDWSRAGGKKQSPINSQNLYLTSSHKGARGGGGGQE